MSEVKVKSTNFAPEPHIKFPSDEDFGKTAWTYRTEEMARAKATEIDSFVVQSHLEASIILDGIQVPVARRSSILGLHFLLLYRFPFS